MKNFSLLILCAGFGKRMLDLTINSPKPLLKINNQTLLGNTINLFSKIGCNEIFINTHYLHSKIETFIIKNFYNYPIKLVYEPSILGTGGAIKNIFNYTKSKKICVVNADIFWQSHNKADLINFLNDSKKITSCKLLLSKESNFFGLKRSQGDFKIKNNLVSNWTKKDKIIFYSGFQIVSKNIFKNTNKIFSINTIWESLMEQKELKGSLIQSDILHIGDKNSFDKQ